MDNIDDILKESYKNTKIDENINIKLKYKIKNYNLRNTIMKIACFLVILVFISFGSLKIFNIYNSNVHYTSKVENEINDNNYNNNNDDSDENNNNLPIPSEKVEMKITTNADLSLTKAPESIVIARIEKIVEYISYVPKLNKTTLPVTKYQAKALKNIKGNVNNTFDFIKSGGVISLADFEKTLTNQQIKNYGLDKKSEEEKKSTYIEIYTSLDLSSTKVEIGKTYLIFMIYNEIYDDLSAISLDYGIMEYNEKSNKVKDNSNNIWIDLNEFLKSKNIVKN